MKCVTCTGDCATCNYSDGVQTCLTCNAVNKLPDSGNAGSCRACVAGDGCNSTCITNCTAN